MIEITISQDKILLRWPIGSALLGSVPMVSAAVVARCGLAVGQQSRAGVAAGQSVAV